VADFSKAEAIGRAVLDYNLEIWMSKTTLEKLAENPGLRFDLLSTIDVEYLRYVGIRWSTDPQHNDIIRLLGDTFTEMNNLGLTLVQEERGPRAYAIAFAKLRTD
jgi:hypothetical protein